jgi:hypothetical protein
MQQELLTYFTGEKNAALVILCVGLLGFVAGVIFFPTRFGLRSFAITLVVFALIEIAIGFGLFFRTGPQVKRLLTQLESDTAAFYANEGTRMETVQRNFVMIQYVEVGVIIISTIIALVFKNRSTISGVAFAFLINAAILLAFDIVAERRGDQYLDEIKLQTAGS